MKKRGLVTLISLMSSAIISLNGCFYSELPTSIKRSYVPVDSVNMKESEEGMQKGILYDIYTPHGDINYHGHFQVLHALRYQKEIYNQETHQLEQIFLVDKKEIRINRNRVVCFKKCG